MLAVIVAVALLGGIAGGVISRITYRQPETRERVSTPAQQLQKSNKDHLSAQEIYRNDSPGVIYIQAGQASGSGFLISKNEILTNAHVVGSQQSVEVKFSNGESTSAKVTARDPSLDVALIKLKDQAKESPLRLGSSSGLKVGEVALAIGNPFGLEQTLTVGVISALNRSISGLDGYNIPNVIQTDAAINPGNSGGPLLNDQGEVIGINSQIVTGGTSKGSVGIGFAVPIDAVKRGLSGLKGGQVRQKAWLGVTGVTVDQEVRDKLKLPDNLSGVLISSIAPASPAQKAGLKPGDIITRIDDDSINRVEQVVEKVAAKKPGQKMKLTYKTRKGGEESLEATLSARPRSSR